MKTDRLEVTKEQQMLQNKKHFLHLCSLLLPLSEETNTQLKVIMANTENRISPRYFHSLSQSHRKEAPV